jgi:hypothetical protein
VRGRSLPLFVHPMVKRFRTAQALTALCHPQNASENQPQETMEPFAGQFLEECQSHARPFKRVSLPDGEREEEHDAWRYSSSDELDRRLEEADLRVTTEVDAASFSRAERPIA